MSRGLLLLVESNTTGTGEQFVLRARRLGAEPVLLSTDPVRYSYTSRCGVRTIVADTSSAAALWPTVVELARGNRIAGVLSSSEYYVATAAELAGRLGLPGQSAAAVRACRDKGAQRRLLLAAGVPGPGFAVAGEVRAARAAADALGPPVVVKPVHGSGSVGVKLCTDAAGAGEHARVLLASSVNERGLPQPRAVLVESHLSGDEFSVELFGGRAILTVAKHLGNPPAFVETGHDLPASLPPRRERELTRCAEEAVAALGLDWGAAHVELRMDGEGPRIIEVNPRLAGGMIPELVRRSLGVDLVEAQVRAALGDPVDLTPTRTGASSIRFLTVSDKGVIDAEAAASASAAARAVPGVVEVVLNPAPGTHVAPAEDFRGRLGHVITVAPASAAAARAAEEAADRLARAVCRPPLGSPAPSVPEVSST